MIGPKKYKLSENDYFNNCKTILNSEVAALKVASDFFNKCVDTKQRFLDTDFGPKD